MEHTKTPWTIGPEEWVGYNDPDTGDFAGICQMNHDPDWQPTIDCDANAAFIVRACNNFEAVLLVAEKMLPLLAQAVNNNAFENIAAGPDYAKRVLDRACKDIERAKDGKCNCDFTRSAIEKAKPKT